jgi:hypothetical protein
MSDLFTPPPAQEWADASPASLFSICVAVALLAALNLQVPVLQAQAPWPLVGWLAGWLIGVAGLLLTYMGVVAMSVTAFGRSPLPVPGPARFLRREKPATQLA